MDEPADVFDDAGIPPRLCACGRQVSVELLDDGSTLLTLICPEHGEIGVIDPFGQ